MLENMKVLFKSDERDLQKSVFFFFHLKKRENKLSVQNHRIIES